MNQQKADHQRIYQVIKSHGEGLPKRNLRKMFWRMGAENFNRHLWLMIRAERSVIEFRAGGKTYVGVREK